jgi:hypothetical protein
MGEGCGTGNMGACYITCSSVSVALFVRVCYSIATSVAEDGAREGIKNTTHLSVFPWSRVSPQDEVRCCTQRP